MQESFIEQYPSQPGTLTQDQVSTLPKGEFDSDFVNSQVLKSLQKLRKNPPKLSSISEQTQQMNSISDVMKVMAHLSENEKLIMEEESSLYQTQAINKQLRQECESLLKDYIENQKERQAKAIQELEALEVELEQMKEHKAYLDDKVCLAQQQYYRLLSSQKLFNFFEKVHQFKKKCCYSMGLCKSDLKAKSIDDTFNGREIMIMSAKHKVKYRVNELIQSTVEFQDSLQLYFQDALKKLKTSKREHRLVINIVTLSLRFGFNFMDAVLEMLSRLTNDGYGLRIWLEGGGRRTDLGELQIQEEKQSKQSCKKSQDLLTENQREQLQSIFESKELPMLLDLELYQKQNQRVVCRIGLVFQPRVLDSLRESALELKQVVKLKWCLKRKKKAAANQQEEVKKPEPPEGMDYSVLLKGKVLLLTVVDLLSEFEEGSRKQTIELFEAFTSFKYE